MTSVQPNQQPSDSGAPRRPAGSPLSRPLGEMSSAPHGGGLGKPRVKMLATSGEHNPTGATYTPPMAAPLPERGAGIHLFLSVLAAVVAVVFLVLLAQKL